MVTAPTRRTLGRSRALDRTALRWRRGLIAKGDRNGDKLLAAVQALGAGIQSLGTGMEQIAASIEQVNMELKTLGPDRRTRNA